MDEALTQSLTTSLRTEHSRDMVKADKRQKEIAKANNNQSHRAVDGLGRPVASFDAAGYMDLKVRQGVGAEDKDFMKWVTKRHPEVAIKCTGTKIQAGYSHVPEGDWPFESRPSGCRHLSKKTYK